MLIVGYNLGKKGWSNIKPKYFNVQCDCSYKKNNWLFKIIKGKHQCQGCYKEYSNYEMEKARKECIAEDKKFYDKYLKEEQKYKDKHYEQH